jgi:hypothetical protein
MGVSVKVDEDAVARASWPIARAILGGPAVRAWLATIVHAFYEKERASIG